MVEFNRELNKVTFQDYDSEEGNVSFDRISNFFGNQPWMFAGLGVLAAGFYFLFSNRRFGFFKSFENLKARDLMTKNPVSCRKDTPLQEVSRLMVESDCGEVPVVDHENKPIGVITDRDIVCRTIAKGLNPMSVLADRVMSTPVETVKVNASAENVIKLMKNDQIRRLPVVDKKGILCGIISQSDIIRVLKEQHSFEVLERVSEPSDKPSRISAA